MLTVDKINKLEYLNSKMADTLNYIQSVLIDGYNYDLPYNAIKKSLQRIEAVDKELSKYYKQLKEV